MSTNIHPTAVVSPEAQIAEDVVVGPFSRVEKDVVIGAGCTIESHAFIDRNTTLGENNFVGHGVVLGTPPQDKKFDPDSKTYLIVGNDNLFREYCTVNRATGEEGETRIGNGNMLMTQSHIAHNCVIGNETVLSNIVQLAGHVEVQDWVILSGIVPIAQYIRLGKGSFMGGLSGIRQDLPPFFRAAGYPGAPVGVNLVGMRRRGCSKEAVRAVGQCYKILYVRGLKLDEALDQMKSEYGQFEEVKLIIDFARESKIGIARPNRD